MKRILLVTTMMALQASIATAGLVNGDFATGNFSGWSTLVSTPALGAGAVVAPVGDGYRAVLTADATSTATATAAVQQTFTVSQPMQFQFDFGFVESLEGLDSQMAGSSDVSIFISQLGGSFRHDWTYYLFNDPSQSLSSLSVTYSPASVLLPSGGTYLFYAQVQAADGPNGNDAYAQLMLGGAALSATAPEPSTLFLALAALGLRSCRFTRRRRCASAR